jgi:uncharacterized glyoxalase superfamily protein PhnB
MSTAKLDAIGLIVSDLARSVRFYRSLGAPFQDAAEASPHGQAEAKLEGGIRFMLDSEASIASFDAAWRPPSGEPRAAIAFHCNTAEEVDTLYAHALASGATSHREPWDAFWGQRYAQLRDRDGNAVDLYAALPPS